MERALKDPQFRSLQERLQALMGRLGHGCPKATIRIGTMCSGIGTSEMVSEFFEEIWNECNPMHPVQARFSNVEV